MSGKQGSPPTAPPDVNPGQSSSHYESDAILIAASIAGRIFAI
jgi:hypothetical protein